MKFKKFILKKRFFITLFSLLILTTSAYFVYKSINKSNPVVSSSINTVHKLNTEGYEDNLSFVAIAKNEGPYIKEWIEFHKLVGVTKFYIYDNESTDNLKEILQDYIDSGEVVYKYYPGQGKQLVAYQEAINDYKNKTKYMGFIDLDEFVIPVENESLTDAIEDIMKKDNKIAGVGINWMIYGSSGLIDKPEGLVTENYKYRAVNGFGANNHIKTICNPRKVIKPLEPHSFKYEPEYYCVNEDSKKIFGPFNPGCSYKKLRINHYFSKSQNEYIKKKDRGLADHTDNLKRTMNDFYAHDKNDVYDYIMEKYMQKLKTNLDLYASPIIKIPTQFKTFIPKLAAGF